VSPNVKKRIADGFSGQVFIDSVLPLEDTSAIRLWAITVGI
jgi:hypothetical protein